LKPCATTYHSDESFRLAGGADSELVALLKRMFTTIKHAKPPASRKDSSEWYVVAQGFKGRTSAPAKADDEAEH
jgi:23S rRNA (uridine2552-2'-O)-methyltransferase